MLDATERIREIMDRESVSQAELARRWGTTSAYVSQVLSGSRNMTLGTLAEIMFVLGRAVELSDTEFGSSLGFTTESFSYDWMAEQRGLAYTTTSAPSEPTEPSPCPVLNGIAA